MIPLRQFLCSADRRAISRSILRAIDRVAASIGIGTSTNGQELYESMRSNWMESRQRYFSMASIVSAGATGDIVDAGCGYGFLVCVLAMAGVGDGIVAFDSDATKAAAARMMVEQLGLDDSIRAVKADARTIRYFQPLCDTMILADVIHTMDAPVARAVLRRMVGAVRDGGRVIVSMPTSKFTPVGEPRFTVDRSMMRWLVAPLEMMEVPYVDGHIATDTEVTGDKPEW